MRRRITYLRVWVLLFGRRGRVHEVRVVVALHLWQLEIYLWKSNQCLLFTS